MLPPSSGLVVRQRVSGCAAGLTMPLAQAYKYIYAWMLAEVGLLDLALKYVEVSQAAVK
jgi:hypothetical protein